MNQNLLAHFLSVAQKNTQFFHDQNVLNVVCEGKIHFLDKQWNIQCCNEVSDQEYGILHYCSKFKPWNTSCHLDEYWWQYAKLTPFYKSFLKKRNKKKWFGKEKDPNGHRYIYCFGIKVLSYQRKKKET